MDCILYFVRWISSLSFITNETMRKSLIFSLTIEGIPQMWYPFFMVSEMFNPHKTFSLSCIYLVSKYFYN